MKKILIPTDFSPSSKKAVQYAVALFEGRPCHFFLLHVNVEDSNYLEKPVYTFGTNILVEKEPHDIDQKLKKLESFAKSMSLDNYNHRFTTIREGGYFLESIRKQVEEKEIELIVMGTKGASEIKEFFLGTRAGDVITKVESDVLVIPIEAKYEGLKEVVFTTDLSMYYTDDLLQSISDMIPSKTARIQILHVTKSDKALTAETKDRKEDLIQRLTKSLPNPVGFHSMNQKNIEQSVLDFAKSISADLIIMVSKDHPLLHRLFLDTTVEEVSFDTDIPLLSLQG